MKKRKPAKKELPTPEYDSKREVGVLLDGMNNNIKAIAEQHGSIKQDIGQLKASIEKRFDRLEVVVMESRKDIKALKEGQKNIESGQSEIKQKLDTVTQDHEQRLHKLETV